MAQWRQTLEGMVKAFEGRRVLITGHTGFKGSWLTLWLHRLGASVSGYSLAPPTDPNLFEAADVASVLVHHFTDDVRNASALSSALQQTEPELVFHLAAQPLVSVGYADPVLTYGSNVMGTVHLLEAARSCPSVRAVVVVTSDKCYAIGDHNEAFCEGDRLGGPDPYASSKSCAELVTESFRSSYWQKDDCPSVATVRAGNILGGGDWAADRLVPDLVRARTQNLELTIRSPDAIRPWQHVLDALHGYLLLAEQLLTEGHPWAEAWNFGPDSEAMKPVQSVVDAMDAHWPNEQEKLVTAEAPAFEETQILRLDSSKARDRLGWEPRLSFQETIEWTAEWYRQFAAGRDMARHTRAKLAAFEDRL